MSGFLRPIVLVFLALAASVPASAQQRPARADRPYLGLFGGNPERPRSSQELSFGATLTGGYDDNALADRGQQGFSPMFQQNGGYAGAELRLDYSNQGQKGSVVAAGGTSYRYYPRLTELTGFNHWGSIGFGWQFNERTSLHATESIAYSPYYNYAHFPGMAPPPPGQAASGSLDYPIEYRPAITYGSSAAFNRRLGRRATLTADYSLSYTDFTREGERPFKYWGAGGRFSYRLTRNATAKLGYHYRRNTYSYVSSALPFDHHEIDAGVDYSRSMSLARRTTLGFTTGSTIYRTYMPEGSVNYNPLYYGTHFMVTGSAYLNSEIGRTWNGRIDYRRGVDYVQGFPNVFLSDSVMAQLVGLAGTRTRLAFAGAYTNGAVGSYGPGQRYDTYTASANLQVAVSTHAALFAQYAFYHYLFDKAIVLPPGMPRGQNRNSVTVGLTLWAPVVQSGHGAAGRRRQAGER